MYRNSIPMSFLLKKEELMLQEKHIFELDTWTGRT
jgi:hypothetical protein